MFHCSSRPSSLHTKLILLLKIFETRIFCIESLNFSRLYWYRGTTAGFSYLEVGWDSRAKIPPRAVSLLADTSDTGQLDPLMWRA
jgi:hypothetical protein